MGLEKDFYEELEYVYRCVPNNRNFVIYENDSVKGFRVCYVNCDSGEVFREFHC